jgi:glyoxylase-like metal-dependent hydrolase (beta-lactamase superfamily II)
MLNRRQFFGALSIGAVAVSTRSFAEETRNSGGRTDYAPPDFKIDNCDISFFVQGFPGKSLSHGGLGWSTITLIRRENRLALLDAGSLGMRALLINRMAKRGLKPADITDLMLTHAHYDHSVNWTLFKNARIVIGAEELQWALKVPWGETPVCETSVRELQGWPTLQTVNAGDEVFPGITAHLAPGHTPGCLVYVLKGSERDLIFTGDAAKNRAELLSRKTDMSYDPKISAATIEMIWGLWRRRPGNLLVPGHDLPMVQEKGVCRYIGKREASIAAWYGDDIEAMTAFDLTTR